MTRASWTGGAFKATLAHHVPSFPGTGQDSVLIPGVRVVAEAPVKENKPVEPISQQQHEAAPTPKAPEPKAALPVPTGLDQQLTQTQDLIMNMKARALAKSKELQDARKQRAVVSKPSPRPSRKEPPSGTSSMAASRSSTQSLGIEARLSPHFAVLENTARDIKSQFDALYGRDGKVLTTIECKAHHVGKAHSMTASKMDVCDDRLDYLFHHQVQGKIQMIMRFRDMSRCELDLRACTLTFHINKPLHQFSGEYSCSSRAYGKGQDGCLVCYLSTRSDAQTLQATLQPVLPMLKVLT